MEQWARSWIPCLLHVYWLFHALHLALGAFALRSWWCESTLQLKLATSTGALAASSPVSAAAYRLLPWLCLALLFWIPGIYLEWPSDPWEHLRRINEWQILDQVTAHSSWQKSSYFLPYSLTGHTTGFDQLSWLNIYYTAVCLLLSWQYFRLARAVGLGERASFIFVLLNALTFGNNIFSFYRYYGLSSSILAQLGAVALIRFVLESARGSPLQSDRRNLIHRIILLLAPCSLLLILTAFNHIQCLGIAGLGILAVIVWRLIEWKRSMFFWLLGAAVVLSIATVLWFPRHPALDEVYRLQGWLNIWYGFNLLAWPSPASERMMHILGLFGLLNLVAGSILLLRRNHVIGWLTLSPFIALSLPFVAIPYANEIADSILVYHRMFLAIPSGLAVVLLARETLTKRRLTSFRRTVLGGLLLPGILLFLLLPSPGIPFSNRAWHFLGRFPSDLSLHPQIQDAATLGQSGLNSRLGQKLTTNEPMDFIFGSIGNPRLATPDNRRILEATAQQPSERINRYFKKISPIPIARATYLPAVLAVTTPVSMSAALSQHWLPQEVALSHVGTPEVMQQLLGTSPTMKPAVTFLPSGGMIVVERHRPHAILHMDDGLRLDYYTAEHMPDIADSRRGWLPFRREQPAYLLGSSASGERHYFSGQGRFKFKLILHPMVSGADVLLSIETLPTLDAIYLIHHRSGGRFYYYVGRNEIGPWSPPAGTTGSPLEIDFSWSDGRQTLIINGTPALQSNLPAASELVTQILIGGEPGKPDRSLHGDILIQQLKLK
jgi:hypothetical protein